jgi:hypothetical protein
VTFVAGFFLVFARRCATLAFTDKTVISQVGEMNILRVGALDLCIWSLSDRYKEKSPESITSTCIEPKKL